MIRVLAYSYDQILDTLVTLFLPSEWGRWLFLIYPITSDITRTIVNEISKFIPIHVVVNLFKIE